MVLDLTNRFPSIFKDGKLKPGIYKIQNIRSETYLDIHQYSNEVCCRPAQDLEEGRGFWEIRNLGAGYSVKMVEPGKPERYCNPMKGVSDGTPLFVTAYPAAWRIEIANNEIYRGFEYVRFYWGPTEKTWDLPNIFESKPNGSKVEFYAEAGEPWQTWKLIPVKVEGAITPSQLVLSKTLGSGPLNEQGKIILLSLFLGFLTFYVTFAFIL